MLHQEDFNAICHFGRLISSRPQGELISHEASPLLIQHYHILCITKLFVVYISNLSSVHLVLQVAVTGFIPCFMRNFQQHEVIVLNRRGF